MIQIYNIKIKYKIFSQLLLNYKLIKSRDRSYKLTKLL